MGKKYEVGDKCHKYPDAALQWIDRVKVGNKRNYECSECVKEEKEPKP